MKNYFTFLFALFALVAHAQVEQVSVGNGYLQQTFYSISSGDETSMPHADWDIAFSIAAQDAGVFINEGVGLSSSFPFPINASYISNSTDFNSADTTGMQRITNAEDNWASGALNSVTTVGNPFDFGWGTYDPMTHVITGSRVFFIKLRTEELKKFQVLTLANGVYTFQYSNLDNSELTTKTLNQADFAGKTRAYFSMESGEAMDLEPMAWDLLFTRYEKTLPNGNETIDYILTGALSNSGVEVVKAEGVDPSTVNHLDYENDYSSSADAIGFDWKYYNMETIQWEILQDRAYFVKTIDDQLWKIQFIDFEGPTTGVITLEKTFIQNITGINDVNSDFESYSIFPNPSTGEFNISFESKRSIDQANLTITNQLGQVVSTKTLDIQQGLNVKPIRLHVTTGIYNCIIQTGKEQFSKKIFVQ